MYLFHALKGPCVDEWGNSVFSAYLIFDLSAESVTEGTPGGNAFCVVNIYPSEYRHSFNYPLPQNELHVSEVVLYLLTIISGLYYEPVTWRRMCLQPIPSLGCYPNEAVSLSPGCMCEASNAVWDSLWLPLTCSLVLVICNLEQRSSNCSRCSCCPRRSRYSRNIWMI